MFGFSKGKMNITIQKTNYAPGDTISGNVALTLKKPVQAREVSISLVGEQVTMQGEQKSTRRIFDFKHQLDGEKECSEGREYHFEMKIPADILGGEPQPPKGKLGQVLKFAKTVATAIGEITQRRLRWYLLAKLDIPGGLDISKRVDITIG